MRPAAVVAFTEMRREDQTVGDLALPDGGELGLVLVRDSRTTQAASAPVGYRRSARPPAGGRGLISPRSPPRLLLGTEIGNNGWIATAWCIGLIALGYRWSTAQFNRDPKWTGRPRPLLPATRPALSACGSTPFCPAGGRAGLVQGGASAAEQRRRALLKRGGAAGSSSPRPVPGAARAAWQS